MADDFVEAGSPDRLLTVYDSTNLDQVTYSFTTKVMIVNFLSGAQYAYEGVNPIEFAWLCGADSVGKEFNKLRNNSGWKETKISG